MLVRIASVGHLPGRNAGDRRVGPLERPVHDGIGADGGPVGNPDPAVNLGSWADIDMIAYLGDIVFPETLPDINALMNVAKGADARLRIDDDQTVMVDPQAGTEYVDRNRKAERPKSERPVFA